MGFPFDIRRATRVLIPLGIIILVLFWLRLPITGQSVWSGEFHQQTEEEHRVFDDQELLEILDDVRGASLGFDRVFAINIPSRTDKRDSITLGASITGIDVEFVDGVDPRDINPKVHPYNWNYEHSETEFACRQAHVNVAQEIVKRKLNSALLLEDDADWDISIKAQLQNFARATRALQRTPLNFTESPYGHDWDLLWLGHCGLACQHDQPHYTTPNDPTVVTPDGLPYYHHGVDDYNRPDHTRLVCTVANAACTFSYALSYRGAQKILAALSVNPSGIIDQVNTNDQIDIVLGRMCKSNFLRCYGAFPGIIGGYMSAGLSSKGTDQSGKDANAHMAPATSQGIMYSTMLNIKRILRGERTVEATSPDAAAPSIIPGEIQIERGQLQEPIGSNRKPDSEPEPEPGPEVESEIE